MKPSFVMDSSIALAWCFEDEATPQTEAILNRMADEAALVPGWWFIEITNVLALAERKGRISAAKVAECIGLLESMELEIDQQAPARAFSDILGICRGYQLTSYDAIYLDLALRRQLPLATLDDALVKAAKKAGVRVLGAG